MTRTSQRRLSPFAVASMAMLVTVHCVSNSPSRGAQEPGEQELFRPGEVQVRLVVLEREGRILAQPPYVGICRSPKVDCPGQVRWIVVTELAENEILKIHGKEGQPACFGEQPFSISAPANSVVSGPPSCPEAQLWLYRVWVEREGHTIAEADPGIIFESN